MHIAHGDGVLLRLSAPAAGETGVPAQVGFHPGHQLSRIEGLGDIVVGAQSQPPDLIHRVGAGGDHQDGHIDPVPYPPADVVAVAARQHQVQEQQVVSAPKSLLSRRLAVGDHRGLEALDLQVVPFQHGNLAVILDDQNFAHGQTSSSQGRAISNTSPWSFRAAMVPPCASTIYLTIYSPRPLPSPPRLPRA